MHSRSREAAGSTMEPESPSVGRPQLNDEQWAIISDLFADPPPDPRGGRPRAPARHCLEGILWVLTSGARWKDLPAEFPSYVTCWRRFAEWSADGVWDEAWGRLIARLDEQGAVDWEESFADGTFASAKKGAIASVRPNAARAPSSWSSLTAEDCRSPWTSTAPVRPKSLSSSR
jgi:transposase